VSGNSHSLPALFCAYEVTSARRDWLMISQFYVVIKSPVGRAGFISSVVPVSEAMSSHDAGI
jgi:hypothetical protein